MHFNGQITYQAAVFESIEHLNVAASLTPLKVAHILPESVYTGQGHQPLRVQLPSVSEQFKACTVRIHICIGFVNMSTRFCI
jgi:hypothetical protein